MHETDTFLFKILQSEWVSGLARKPLIFNMSWQCRITLKKKIRLRIFYLKKNVTLGGKNQQNFTGSWDQSYADFRFGTVGIQDVY